jgi:hypothetical protein
MLPCDKFVEAPGDKLASFSGELRVPALQAPLIWYSIKRFGVFEFSNSYQIGAVRQYRFYTLICAGANGRTIFKNRFLSEKFVSSSFGDSGIVASLGQ